MARKKDLAAPIILLIDPASEEQVERLKEAGATDYIVRGLINDDMLYRILDYSIALNHVTLQHEQVLEQQRIERAAQQTGEGLRSIAAAAGNSGSSIASVATPLHRAQTQPASDTPQRALAENLSQTGLRPWKLTVLGLIVAVLLVGAGVLNQRLNNESRLSRLEASNELLSEQVLQLHSDLALGRLAPVSAASATPAVAPAPESTLTSSPAVAVPGARESGRIDEQMPITAIDGPNHGRWFINLGTFSSHSAARQFTNNLGLSANELEVRPVELGSKTLYRVRSASLPSAEAAAALAMDYQVKLGGDRPWVGQE